MVRSLHKAALEHKTTSQMIQYWHSTRQDHQVILNSPDMASMLIDNFLDLARRLLTEDVENGFVFAKQF